MRRLGVAAIAGAVALLATCMGSESPPRERKSASAPARSAPARSSAALTVFFTGSDDGYLDACGCDDGLLGGLPRRDTLLKGLGSQRDGSLLLSNGRLVTGRTPLDGMKLETILVAMQTMGYDAIALTERELALGRETSAAFAEYLAPDCSFLGTNLEDERPPDDPDVLPLPRERAVVRNFADREVLVLAAAVESRAAAYRAADPHLGVSDPVEALRREIEARPGAWKVIALAQASLEEAEALARAVPRLDLVIVQGPEHEDHPSHDSARVGSTSIVTTGRKGKFLGTFRFGGEGELDEFRSEPVVDSLEKSTDVQSLILRYYRDRLVEEVPRPIEAFYERRPAPSGATYVGADEGSCASCHPKAWDTWARSRHARAWKTLVDQDLPPRPQDRKGRLKNAIWDPDCVRCHVTGFGEVSGYAGPEQEAARRDAPLVNVTCEACHGPAGDHAERAQRGDDVYPGGHLPRVWSAEEAARDPAAALRDNPKVEALCMTCHDPDNSPNFDLRGYWVGLVRGEQREPVAHGKE